jgi:hypothetical protein
MDKSNRIKFSRHRFHSGNAGGFPDGQNEIVPLRPQCLAVKKILPLPLTIRAAPISEFYIVANLYQLIHHPKLSAVG